MFSSLILPSPSLPAVGGEDEEVEADFPRSADTTRELPVRETNVDEKQEGLELEEEKMENQLAKGADYRTNGANAVQAIEKGIASTSPKDSRTRSSSIKDAKIPVLTKSQAAETKAPAGESNVSSLSLGFIVPLECEIDKAGRYRGAKSMCHRSFHRPRRVSPPPGVGEGWGFKGVRSHSKMRDDRCCTSIVSFHIIRSITAHHESRTPSTRDDAS